MNRPPLSSTLICSLIIFSGFLKCSNNPIEKTRSNDFSG